SQALDQPHPETPLQLADLQADGRLGQMELARRRREASSLDHLDEGPQLIEVEAAHPQVFLIESIETTNLPYFALRCKVIRSDGLGGFAAAEAMPRERAAWRPPINSFGRPLVR